MKKLITIIATAASLTLSGCASNMNHGATNAQKLGLGGALACGAVGALTHGSRGAVNAAVACGLVGTGVGVYMDKQEAELRAKLDRSQVQIRRSGDVIKLVLPEGVTFATSSYRVNRQAAASLTSVAQVLRAYPETQVVISGHTDSTGKRHRNLLLSEKRADAVASVLVAEGLTSSPP